MCSTSCHAFHSTTQHVHAHTHTHPVPSHLQVRSDQMAAEMDKRQTSYMRREEQLQQEVTDLKVCSACIVHVGEGEKDRVCERKRHVWLFMCMCGWIAVPLALGNFMSEPAHAKYMHTHTHTYMLPTLLQAQLARAQGERSAEADARFGEASKNIKELHSQASV